MSIDDELEKRAAEYRSDRRSTEDLLSLALSIDVDADNLECWQPIFVLQHRLPAIIEHIKPLARTNNDKSRELAATILGQNGVREKAAMGECVEFLQAMLAREESPSVLASIAFALGHLHDPRSITSLLPLREHADAQVRYAVVHSLCGHQDARAIEALITLSADLDHEVRNWATFALGSQIDTNTPEICDALLARLEEDDSEIRGEALVGLAQRGDIRVAQPLIRELASESRDVLRNWILMDYAAQAVIHGAQQAPQTAWLPVLEKLKVLELGDPSALNSAIQHCSSSGP